tara:strand:+ start:439 stop:627 length:189 start_codon:yes stop_codon:yes gene_type:complete
VVDADAQVEKALIQEMEAAFQEFGIEARILSVNDLELNEDKFLEIPLQVREKRDIYLNSNEE